VVDFMCSYRLHLSIFYEVYVVIFKLTFKRFLFILVGTVKADAKCC